LSISVQGEPATNWRFKTTALVATFALVLAGMVGLAAPALAYTMTCGNYGDTPSFSCVSYSGYHGQQPWGYPVDANGHNCTNYASYRLWQNGVANPGNLGNAKDWDNSAVGYGITVNNTPAAGAIAVWEANSAPAGASGHVAYVDAATGSYIDISEDNYGGTSMRKRFYTGESAWPDHFIHFKDLDTGGGGSSDPTTPSTHIRTIAGQFNLDFDHDGRQDVAQFRRMPSDLLRLYVTWGEDDRGPKTTTNVWETGYPTGLDVTPVGVDDVDGDGFDDILVFKRTTSDLLRLYVIWGTNGRNTRTATSIWETGYDTSRKVVPAGIADYDGDGIKDVSFFLKAGNDDLLRLYTVWGSHDRDSHTATNMWEMSYPSGRKVYPAGVADFDNDGKRDISVFVRLGDNDLLRLYTIWGAAGRNSRPATNMWEAGYPANLDVSPAGVTDFDQDDRDDIMVFSRTSSGLLRLYAIWGGDSRNARTATNLWQKTYPITRQAIPAGITDFDGDGPSDVSVLVLDGDNDLLRLYTIWGAAGRSARASTNMWEKGYNGMRKLASLSPSDLDTDQKSDISFFVMAGDNDLPRLMTVWGDTGRDARLGTIPWEGSGTYFSLPAM
jgi:surface antigen